MAGESIQVSRIYRLEGDSKTRAFVDVDFDGFIVKGLRIVEGKNGLFLSMPQHQGKDGRWYNTVFPATKEKQQALSRMVLNAYQE
jgi:stage V sporulation protein G